MTKPVLDLDAMRAQAKIAKEQLSTRLGQCAVWSPANALAVLDRLREAETVLGADTGVDCFVCGQRIFGSMRGMGDGAGQRFGHDGCYWRVRAEKAEARVAELEGRGR